MTEFLRLYVFWFHHKSFTTIWLSLSWWGTNWGSRICVGITIQAEMMISFPHQIYIIYMWAVMNAYNRVDFELRSMSPCRLRPPVLSKHICLAHWVVVIYRFYCSSLWAFSFRHVGSELFKSGAGCQGLLKGSNSRYLNIRIVIKVIPSTVTATDYSINSS